MQQELKKLQHAENQAYIKKQIADRQRSRVKETKQIRSENDKPHFGPEETEEFVDVQRMKEREQKERVKKGYLDHIQLKNMDRLLEKEIENAQDTKNLEILMEMQTSEEAAKKLLKHQNQKKLAKTWQEQMELKRMQKDYEKIFN